MSFFSETPLSVAIENAAAKAEADGTMVIIETTTADARGITTTDRVERGNLAAQVMVAALRGGSIEVHLVAKHDRGSAWAESGPEGWTWNGEHGSSVVHRFLANVMS